MKKSYLNFQHFIVYNWFDIHIPLPVTLYIETKLRFFMGLVDVMLPTAWDYGQSEDVVGRFVFGCDVSRSMQTLVHYFKEPRHVID